MKHSNISIFVPHVGCPHMCSFCNQNTISGAQHLPTGEDVREICKKAAEEVKSPENTEIAFFGGSFTAIPSGYMNELLEAAGEFVGEGKFRGIRISTRPDCIDGEILDTLKNYGVTAIELGAQSMNDEVLEANDRGHTVRDIVDSSRLIKEYGFELGLQMMTGLYKSTFDTEYKTALEIIRLRPETVRIYPVVVLKGTRLAKLYESGEYRLIPFEVMVENCGILLEEFALHSINVIKCGLHASEFVEQDMVAGYYHPAFRELCETDIYRNSMEHMMNLCRFSGSECTFEVSPTCISKAVGHKKSNVEYFSQKGIRIKILGNPDIPVYEAAIRE